MAYTAAEYARMQADLDGRRKRCRVHERAPVSDHVCGECRADAYYDALSDIIDQHPIGFPGSYRGGAPSGGSTP